MDQQLITRIVEAALLAASQPLTVVQLRGLFPLDEPAPEGAVEKALETLQAGCAERGIELVEVASGWRFQVAGDVHAWVARLWTERQTRYTRATLETLALIAYRQPITRGEIEQVRGVATNSNIIKALEEREWIRVVGHRDIPGRPELLGTTKAFLDYFGLKRLDELPPLSELKDFGELEPQFKFDPAAPDGDAMPLGDLPAEDAADTADEGPADVADAAEAADAASEDAEAEAEAEGEERAAAPADAGASIDGEAGTDADVQPDPATDTRSGPRPDLPGPAAASDGDPATTQDDDTQRDALAADGDSERSTS